MQNTKWVIGWRHWGRIALWLLGVLVLVAAIASVALATIDLKPILEHEASRRSGRNVHVGAFAIAWGNPVVLKVSDFHLGNAPGGHASDLVSVAQLVADIELWPLLRGELRLRQVRLEQPLIALERNSDRIGNWKLHPDRPAKPEPPRRTKMPFIADLTLHAGEITLRTTSGATLHIRLDDVRLRAPGVDAPAHIAAKGAYNDVALQMELHTQSYAVLWQTSVPFGIDLTAKAANTTLTFQGGATAPLDFDGLNGALAIQSDRLDDWLSIFGMSRQAPVPLQFGGTLAKQGDHWELGDTTGKLVSSNFSGLLTLDEGKSGAPDHFVVNLDFMPVDLKHLVDLATPNAPRPAATPVLSLSVETQPSETFNIRLGVQQATYSNLKLSDLRLAAALAPGRFSVSELSLGLAGGGLRAIGSVEAVSRGGRAVLDVAVTQADAATLVRYFGSNAAMLSGRLDGSATLEMSGETTADALRASHGQIVLGITHGRISRDLLEKASTNLSQLFGRSTGSATLGCLLGIASLNNGHVSVAPLRLRTSEGNLFGGGSLDLLARHLDLQLKSEAASTGFFALDLPVQITGSFASPDTGLSSSFNPTAIGAQASRNLARLAPASRRVVDHNPCVG